jgi:hypothetical protein
MRRRLLMCLALAMVVWLGAVQPARAGEPICPFIGIGNGCPTREDACDSEGLLECFLKKRICIFIVCGCRPRQ